MTSLWALLAFLAAPAFPLAGPSIDTFRQLEQQLAESYLKADRAFVDRLLADDWTSTDYRGRIRTKAEVLAMFNPGGPTFSRVEIDVDRVRLYGDVAVVTGRSLAAGRLEGRDITIVQRYTDVFVSRDGNWRVVVSQGTQVQ